MLRKWSFSIFACIVSTYKSPHSFCKITNLKICIEKKLTRRLWKRAMTHHLCMIFIQYLSDYIQLYTVISKYKTSTPKCVWFKLTSLKFITITNLQLIVAILLLLSSSCRKYRLISLVVAYVFLFCHKVAKIIENLFVIPIVLGERFLNRLSSKKYLMANLSSKKPLTSFHF